MSSSGNTFRDDPEPWEDIQSDGLDNARAEILKKFNEQQDISLSIGSKKLSDVVKITSILHGAQEQILELCLYISDQPEAIISPLGLEASTHTRIIKVAIDITHRAIAELSDTAREAIAENLIDPEETTGIELVNANFRLSEAVKQARIRLICYHAAMARNDILGIAEIRPTPAQKLIPEDSPLRNVPPAFREQANAAAYATFLHSLRRTLRKNESNVKNWIAAFSVSDTSLNFEFAVDAVSEEIMPTFNKHANYEIEAFDITSEENQKLTIGMPAIFAALKSMQSPLQKIDRTVLATCIVHDLIARRENALLLPDDHPIEEQELIIMNMTNQALWNFFQKMQGEKSPPKKRSRKKDPQ